MVHWICIKDWSGFEDIIPNWGGDEEMSVFTKPPKVCWWSFLECMCSPSFIKVYSPSFIKCGGQVSSPYIKGWIRINQITNLQHQHISSLNIFSLYVLHYLTNFIYSTSPQHYVFYWLYNVLNKILISLIVFRLKFSFSLSFSSLCLHNNAYLL